MVAEHLRPIAFYKASETVDATARSGGWRRRSTSSCWRASRAPTATAAPARSIARRWTGSSSAPATLGVEHKPPAPILMGRHLIEMGVAPGPRMGEILKAVYELQLDGAVTTLDEAHGRRSRG